MSVRGEGGNLKYEFHLKPGASVEDVRLGYRGAEGLSVGAGGELVVQTSLGVLEDAAPVSYQRIGGERVAVESRYTLLGGMAATALRWGRTTLATRSSSTPGSTTPPSWGTAGDTGSGIAVRDSMPYVTGSTGSSDYPTTPGAFDTIYNGNTDAFVTKLNASGSALVYSTFLGGERDIDGGRDIAVDKTGSAYVTGRAWSPDYPTTPGAFDTTFNGNFQDADAFVTKLNASGSALAYSTFLGGTIVEETSGDEGFGIAVRYGRAYVTGTTFSPDYPTTRGAFDTTFNGIPGDQADAFVTKLNASGSALAYSTFLGGTGDEAGSDIAVDGRDRAYVTGRTDSADYPTTRGAFDTSYNGNRDAFVTKLPTG